MRVLRAFAWLRWRVLMNSLERTGARDAVERFSIATEQLGPILAGLLMIPSAVFLAGAGAYSGWALASGNLRPLPFEILRYLLLAACALTIVGPFLLPAGGRTNAVRLLLLPISRRMLYTAQAATTLTDPWLLLIVPAVAAVPMGLAAGGAWGTAIVAAAAGVLLLVVLIGFTSLATSLIHLLVRDRRRGELLALVFILVLPFVWLFPQLIEGGDSRTRAERRADRTRGTPAWLIAIERHALPAVPSELYVRSTRAAAGRRVSEAVPPLAALSVVAGLLHAAAFVAFGRVLDSPGATGGRRKTVRRRSRAHRIPGLSRGASAVALAQIRLALRTPRGRSIFLSPVVVFLMFAAMMWRGGSRAEFGFVSLGSGIALAAFGSFVSLVSILPLAVNQFAIDRAGLTLAFLSPLDDRELLRGKAVGNAIVAGVPAVFCVAAAAAVFPGGPLSLWLSVPLGTAASYLLVAPVAAALSAIFPRAVDLNSIGRGSNAHGAAGFLGFIAFLAAGAPCLLLAALATRMLDRPHFTPLLLLGWCAVCGGLARLLFSAAQALLASRRENLALII